MDHWESVRTYYEEQFRRPIVIVDAHAGLAYAALGETEQLTACIAQLQELGEAGRLPAETTAASLTRAYEAFAAEQWATTIGILEPLIDQVVRIGGSRAQRDLQTNTLLAAYVNEGRTADAQAFVEKVEGPPAIATGRRFRAELTLGSAGGSRPMPPRTMPASTFRQSTA